MRKITPLLLCGSILGLCPALADDSDLLVLGSQVKPNVVILIDSSGSMDDRIDGARKIDSAKSVIENLIENVEGINFAVFSFNDTDDGGKLIAPDSDDVDSMVDAVTGVVADGYTPLGRATQTIQDYYKGNYTETVGSGGWGDDDDDGGSSGGWGSWGGWGWGGYGNEEEEEEEEEEDEEGSSSSTTVIDYPSPIEYECQLNYAILVTDGLPCCDGEAETLVSDVAANMYVTDHSNLPGIQNVITHAIGFDIPEGRDLLTTTAERGGGSFFEASNATELEAALRASLSQVLEQSHSFTSPLIPSTSANGGDKAYIASFRPTAASPLWNGFLGAYRRASDGSVPVDDEGIPQSTALVWEAGTKLNEKRSSERKIYTVSSSDALVEFTTANAGRFARALGTRTDAERDKLINFVRGVDSYDADLDDDVTEDRSWKLGDIYHSSPVLVFPPPLHSSDEGYLAFKEAKKNRKTIVLIGANDGMLHAFDAETGAELWAFVPPDQLPRLHYLTQSVGGHTYFVDSTAIVADVEWDDTWRTVAIFGERRGGYGYHALDITDTENPVYLWTYSEVDMGESWSEPVISRIKVADDGEKYVAFMGGGFDTENNNALGDAMFAVDIENGATLWKYENTGTGDSAYMNFSIAASPTAADLDHDGYTDRVYIGDVGGQLWKFDVSGAATLTSGLVDNWTGKRMFAADAAQPNPPADGAYYPNQALFVPPAIAYGPEGGLWAFFGTGDRNNPLRDAANRLFGVLDNGTMTNGESLTTSDLVDADSDDELANGWYLDLASGEKVLAPANVFDESVLFGTMTPTTITACGGGTATAKIYAVSMSRAEATVDWDDDGDKERSDTIGTGVPSKPQVTPGDDGSRITTSTTDDQLVEDALPTGRARTVRYWREVF